METIIPFSIGGAKAGEGGALTVTHKTILIGPEFTDEVKIIYFSPDSNKNLLSFGLFLRFGYKFNFPTIGGIAHQIVRHPTTSTVISDTVLGKNNIFKIPSSFFNRVNSPLMNLQCNIIDHLPHLNKEERNRVKQVEAMHIFYKHPNGVFLRSAISNHIIEGLSLCEQDVHNFELKECDGCNRIKMKFGPYPQSTHPPANSIGGCVSLDPNQLQAISSKGYTVEITSLDEKSQYAKMIGIISKSTKQITKGSNELYRTVTVPRALG